MGQLRSRAIFIILTIWLSVPLTSRTFVIKTVYIAHGNGVVGSSVFSKHLILAPTIPGAQERVSADLYVNGLAVSYKVGVDQEGNEYADPGPLAFTGAVNLTLVQTVRTVSPPFRMRFELPTDTSWERATSKLPKNSFWRCNSSKVKVVDLEKLSWELRSRAETPDRYILNVVQWTLERFNYSVDSDGGVRCPAMFLEKLTGPCGDVHAFIAALLKMQGIDAALVYALVVDPSAKQELGSQTVNYVLVGALPHIFTVANLSGKAVPIDLTAGTGETAEEEILWASFNIFDNIIALYKVKESDPNDYLLVHFAEGAERVSLQVTVEEDRSEAFTKTLVLLASIAALSLLLRRVPGTSRN